MAQVSKYESFARFAAEYAATHGHPPTYPAITAALGLSPRTIAKYFKVLRQESLFPAPPPPAPQTVPPSPPSPPAPEPGLAAVQFLTRDNLRLEQFLAAAQARISEQERTIAHLQLQLAKLEAKLLQQQERYNELVTEGKNEIRELAGAILKKNG